MPICQIVGKFTILLSAWFLADSRKSTKIHSPMVWVIFSEKRAYKRNSTLSQRNLFVTIWFTGDNFILQFSNFNQNTSACHLHLAKTTFLMRFWAQFRVEKVRISTGEKSIAAHGNCNRRTRRLKSLHTEISNSANYGPFFGTTENDTMTAKCPIILHTDFMFADKRDAIRHNYFLHVLQQNNTAKSGYQHIWTLKNSHENSTFCDFLCKNAKSF